MKFPVYSLDGKILLGHVVIEDVPKYKTMNSISFVDTEGVSTFVNILSNSKLNVACDQLKFGIRIGHALKNAK